MKQHHRQPAHARERFAVIKRYLTSSLSQIAFCRQKGLAYSKFNYWLKQYCLREALAAKTATPENKDATDHPPVDFIPLRITPAEPAASSPTCEKAFSSNIA